MLVKKIDDFELVFNLFHPSFTDLLVFTYMKLTFATNYIN